ncbi:unknown [Clostridium sp. CAG:575]|nr:unknown [Clostridium sp. CAG:575]
MEDIKKFISEYKGAIIGVIVAIVILATRLYDVIVGILLLLAGAFIGNYVQRNKDDVKAKLKKFIDKM